ncbi:hypothetical protein N9R43_01280 [bacterium]|nr:hypothetical protein [bacterium]
MSDMSKWKKLVESATKNIVENDAEDMAQQDHEVSMAKSQLLSVVKSATRIAKLLQGKSEEEGLEGWVASKLTMAEDYLQAVADHMDGQEITEGYKVLPPMDPKYVERKGLEGPFTTLSGKVVYYDSKEGSYYDPDTDMYISYDDFRHYDNDYKDMKDERDEVNEVSNEVKDQLANIDLSIRNWERRWKNKSTGNPNDMKAPQKIKDLKAQKAVLMKKHDISEEKTRLDPKCWDDNKIGKPATKMKNGVRVNNCVPK